MTARTISRNCEGDDRFGETVALLMGPYLILADLPAVERRAVEDKKRALTNDADRLVRLGFAQTIKHQDRLAMHTAAREPGDGNRQVGELGKRYG